MKWYIYVVYHATQEDIKNACKKLNEVIPHNYNVGTKETFCTKTRMILC